MRAILAESIATARAYSEFVDNGVLLCRFHHMMIHNQGWTIRPPHRAGGEWRMHPPPGGVTARHPIVLVSKNPIRRARSA